MNSNVYVLFLLLILLTVIAAGCTTSSDKNKVGNTVIVNPIEYGNGVLFFSCTEARFANSLSSYLELHPDMRVDAIAGDGTGIHGLDQGYFVVVEKR
jgi:hypothetical protein